MPDDVSPQYLKYLLDLGLHPIVRSSINFRHHILKYFDEYDVTCYSIREFVSADKSLVLSIFDTDFLRWHIYPIKRDALC